MSMYLIKTKEVVPEIIKVRVPEGHYAIRNLDNLLVF